jgi:hypothetical protein
MEVVSCCRFFSTKWTDIFHSAGVSLLLVDITNVTIHGLDSREGLVTDEAIVLISAKIILILRTR